MKNGWIDAFHTVKRRFCEKWGQCVFGEHKAEDAEEAMEKWVEEQQGWMGRETKWKQERSDNECQKGILIRVRHWVQ